MTDAIMVSHCANEVLDQGSMTEFCEMELTSDQCVCYPDLCSPTSCRYYRKQYVQQYNGPRFSVETLTEQMARHLLIDVDIVDHMDRLRYGIAQTRVDLESQYSWYNDLNDVRRGVLINLAYTIDIGRLCEYPALLDSMRQRNYKNAAASIERLDHPKLDRSRLDELATLMLDGESQR